MNELLYKEQPIVGLEFSQSGFRMMSINTQNWQVLGYGAADINVGKSLRNLNEDDIAKLAKVLKSLTLEHIIGNINPHRSHAAISIPAGLTYTRLITLPKEAEENLVEAIQLEAEQYIPIPAAELYIDYEVVFSDKDKLNVLMCACPSKVVDTMLAIVEEAGLKPVHIEPSTMSVARLLSATESGDLPSLIVDIGESDTDIAVLDKTIRVSGTLDVGDGALINGLMKKLSIDKQAAIQVKNLRGLSAGHQRPKILASIEDSLLEIVSEIQKTLRFYAERMSSEKSIQQVLIIGEGSSMPGIGEYFTDKLMLPARVASPWQELHFDHISAPQKQLKPLLSTAAGLALVKPKDVK
jgi:type IV pilus assembly protein PilM